MTIYPVVSVEKVNEGFNIYMVNQECDVRGVTIIPVGFFTDFASVPRILWPLIPPQGEAMPASVLHDYFYTVHPLGTPEGQEPRSTDMPMEEERLFADNLFRQHLMERGLAKWQVTAMYKAVRWFGKFRFEHYGRSRKRVRVERKLKENRADKKIV